MFVLRYKMSVSPRYSQNVQYSSSRNQQFPLERDRQKIVKFRGMLEIAQLRLHRHLMSREGDSEYEIIKLSD